MTEVRRRDERADADPLGGERGGGESRDRSEPSLIAEHPPGEMVICPGVRETELVGATPTRHGLFPWGLGKYRHTESHPATLRATSRLWHRIVQPIAATC